MTEALSPRSLLFAALVASASSSMCWLRIRFGVGILFLIAPRMRIRCDDGQHRAGDGTRLLVMAECFAGGVPRLLRCCFPFYLPVMFISSR